MSREREPSNLADDTAVTRLRAAPGWYIADLPDRWSFVTPQGGVLMAVAMRAMVHELGDSELSPVSANTVFCSPVPHGPLEIRVEVLRRGNAAAQLRAALSSTALPGPGLEVTATFARERSGPEVLDARFPDVPDPDDAEDIRIDEPHNPHWRWSFFDNFDLRLAIGNAWWRDDWSPDEARHGRWFRFRVPQTVGGTLDPLALCVLADTMPAALIQKMGPGGPRFRAPSLDLTVHFLEPTDSEWFLVTSHVRRARAGYATADVEIWSEARDLIAYGAQMMILRNRK